MGCREGGFRDRVLEDTGVDSRLHVARKDRRPDEWDPPIEPHALYGPGNDFDVIDESQTRLAEPQTRLTADEEEA